MVFEGYRPGYGFYNGFGALTRPLLKRGSRGPAVEEAQKKLMEVLQRSFRFGADGVFGQETETAVRDAQAQFGLPITGVIGADTWTLLLAQEVQIEGASGSVPSGPPSQNDGDLVTGAPPSKIGNAAMMGVAAVALVGAYLLLKK